MYYNKPITKWPVCDRCGYSLRPEGSCPNHQCQRYPTGHAMNVSDLLQYEPIPLFHGRRWGNWWLDAERLCLVHQPRGGSAWDYEVDIERIDSSAEMIDWIFQLNHKAFISAKDIADLVAALDDIFHPQANLCPGGGDKRIENPTVFLRQRIRGAGDP